MRYPFTLTLYDDTLILGVATVESVGRGHEGIEVGDWSLTSVLEPGEPALSIETGDGDAIVRWIATRHAEMDFEITRHFNQFLNPFQVADDEQALEAAVDVMIDGDVDERIAASDFTESHLRKILH
jgi:hypothetical protein